MINDAYTDYRFMMSLNNIKVFSFVLGYMVFIDAIWLKYVTGQFFIDHAKSVFREDGIILWSAVVVYILMTLGLMLFVKPQVVKNESLWSVFIYGSMFGLVLYGVFDFTNHAILKQWPAKLIVLDLLWGAFLLGSSSIVLKKVLC